MLSNFNPWSNCQMIQKNNTSWISEQKYSLGSLGRGAKLAGRFGVTGTGTDADTCWKLGWTERKKQLIACWQIKHLDSQNGCWGSIDMCVSICVVIGTNGEGKVDGGWLWNDGSTDPLMRGICGPTDTCCWGDCWIFIFITELSVYSIEPTPRWLPSPSRNLNIIIKLQLLIIHYKQGWAEKQWLRSYQKSKMKEAVKLL